MAPKRDRKRDREKLMLLNRDLGLAGAHLAEAALAQHAVHPERLVGDRRPLQPLPLQIAVEVLRLAELLERLPTEVLLHLRVRTARIVISSSEQIVTLHQRSN